MTRWLQPGPLLRSLCLLAAGLALAAQEDLAALRKRLRGRTDLTLLVTDSGLGGVSVAAGIEARARALGTHRRLKIVFVNAMPTAKKGYNKMEPDEKVDVFQAALEAMRRRYRPDAILIACNTLSVVYPQTPFARKAPIPVVGIVGLGVDQLAEALARQPEAVATVYGTETTVESDAHRQGLLARGIPPERIRTVACPGLAGKIQNDAASAKVKEAIEGFVKGALPGPPPPAAVVGLCCTHYGYSSPLWTASTQAAGTAQVVLVNPNERMCELPFTGLKQHRFRRPATSVLVASRAELSPEARANIAALVRAESPATAEALMNYVHVPELWPYPSPKIRQESPCPASH